MIEHGAGALSANAEDDSASRNGIREFADLGASEQFMWIHCEQPDLFGCFGGGLEATPILDDGFSSRVKHVVSVNCHFQCLSTSCDDEFDDSRR